MTTFCFCASRRTRSNFITRSQQTQQQLQWQWQWPLQLQRIHYPKQQLRQQQQRQRYTNISTINRHPTIITFCRFHKTSATKRNNQRQKNISTETTKTMTLKTLKPNTKASKGKAMNKKSSRNTAAVAAVDAGHIDDKADDVNGVVAANECKTPANSQWISAPSNLGRNDDALARYPNITTAGGMLRGLDYAGTVTFAITGSITAAQSGLDVFGCTLVAVVTAVGGGTIRDAIVLSKRPFWTTETEYLWMTCLAGCLTFYLWPHLETWRQQQQQQDQDQEPATKPPQEQLVILYDKIDGMLDTLDAIGLSAFVNVGAQNGIRAGMPMIVSAICGMTTSTFGGLMRDVVCDRPVRIVHSYSEMYALPALAGTVIYLVAKARQASPSVRIGCALATCMGSRFVAVNYDVRVHTWDTLHDGRGIAVRRQSKTPH